MRVDLWFEVYGGLTHQARDLHVSAYHTPQTVNRDPMNNLSLYIQALVYVAAGLNHFISPKMYLAIMPPYVPAHQLMVTLSGIAEIVLGIGLLFPATRSLSAWGLILLLIAVFPANVYMATADQFHDVSALIRWGRLPLQGVLIWWAYRYTHLH